MFASMVYSASAFGVRQRVAKRAFTSTTTTTTTTTTRLNANVLKLTEPKSQLLDEVDVFIFDCDGVIWRVCCSFALALV